MTDRKPGMTVGSGQQIFGSDDISAAEKHQEEQRLRAAYEQGLNRRESIQNDPTGPSGSEEYGKIKDENEKAAYRKGFRGAAYDEPETN